MFNKENFYRNLNKYRKTIQIFSLLFLFSIPVLILFEIRQIIGNLYSISFWDLAIIDPSMILQTTILSKEIYLPLLIAAIIPILLALLLGKVFCSWMCPYNTVLEPFDLKSIEKVQKKIFKKKNRPNKIPNKSIYWGIFILFLVISMLTGFPILTWLSMPGIISSEIFAAVTGLGIGISTVVFGIVFVTELIIGKRYWCKFVCPVGATLSIFKTKYTMHISYDESACDCAAFIEPCTRNCPLELKPKENDLYPYCFNCGRCIKVCEQTGNRALSFSVSKN